MPQGRISRYGRYGQRRHAPFACVDSAPAPGPWTPESIPGVVGYWDRDAASCLTDAASLYDGGAVSYHAMPTTDATLEPDDTEEGFTWVSLVRLDANARGTVFGHGFVSGGKYPLGSLYFSFASQPRVVFDTTDGNSYLGGTEAFTLGTWYMMVGLVNPDTNEMRLMYRTAAGGSWYDTGWVSKPNATRNYNTLQNRMIAGYKYDATFDVAVKCPAMYYRLLTDVEIDALYDSGNFYTPDDLPTDELKAAYALGQDGGATDITGNGYDMTAYNTPAIVQGPVSHAPIERMPVHTQTGGGGLARTQTTIGYQPLWYPNSGDPYLDFDGVDDYFDVVIADASLSWSYGIRHDIDNVGAQRLFDSQTGRLIISSRTSGGDGSAGMLDSTWRNVGTLATTGDHRLVFVGNAGVGLDVYEDGSALGSTATWVGNGVGGTCKFFTAHTGPGSGVGLQGKLFRDCIVAGAISEADRALLETWLAA